MDLDQLFTIRDYVTTIIRIPCHDELREEGSKDPPKLPLQSHHQADPTKQEADLDGSSDDDGSDFISIPVASSTAASTDYDLTGQVLWPVSRLLAHYLASRHGQACIRNKNIVELGAGTGLPGLVAARYARNVVVTDGNEDVVMELLCKNVEMNSDESRNNIQAVPLTWGVRDNCRDVIESIPDRRVDVVIAADVVQWPAVVEPFLHTVKALLWTKIKADEERFEVSKSISPPMLILGLVTRAMDTTDLFLKLAQELGFCVVQIEPSAFLPNNGEVPQSCQEFGGRETKIYHVTLTDLQVPPEIDLSGTEENHSTNSKARSKDFLVGRNFEHTAFLPC